ncbi:MAG: nuclear transport factor 2 family protein [Hyphomicrobiaceae bacterium]|nr:nuclear transport factor 2 family protein [Hyphomicrobiaceae bacterium]
MQVPMADLRLDTAALIEALLEARYANDFQLMLAGFAAESRLRFVGNSNCEPFAGDWSGHAGIVEGLDRLRQAFAFEDFAIDDVLVDRDRAAVRYTVLVRCRATGAEFELEVMAHIVLRGSLIVSMTEFADTRLFSPHVRANDDFPLQAGRPAA